MTQIIHSLERISPKERVELREQLTGEVLSLSFHAYEHLIQELLTKLGYAQARLLDRTSWRQCTNHGGMDMEAYAKIGITAERIVLQIKQYRRPVSRRFVDELRGVVLRTGAGQGVIITTSTFSAVARKAALEDKTAPIRLVDGHELTQLLLHYGVGVLKQESGKSRLRTRDAKLKSDSEFFTDLRTRFPDNRKNSSPQQTSALLPTRLTSLSVPEDERESGHMLWRTHILAGMNSLWVLAVIPQAVTPDTIAPLIALSAIGSLLPDLDAVQSKIKNVSVFKIKPLIHVSLIFNRLFGHRGALHSPISLLFVAVLAVPLAFWFSWPYSAALWFGYASHLTMDACTIRGISLYPFSGKRINLLPASLRVTTGSVAEDVIFTLLALALMRFLLIYVLRLIS